MRIGFVDHHLNNYHANKFLELLSDGSRYPDVQVATAWESHPAGDDWCATNGVRRAGDIPEVLRHSDAVIVLAPDNCEAHHALCSAVLPAGLPTFIDKFLAHSPAEAEAIVSLAERYGSPMFAASSLRFAVELAPALADPHPISDAWAVGMGYWAGYGVHTLSLVYAAMGHDVARLCDTGAGDNAVVCMEYRDGRRAWMDVRKAPNQWDTLAWRFGFRRDSGYSVGHVTDFHGFYAALMERVVALFRGGAPAVTAGEMLATVDVLAAAEVSRGADAAWVTLPNRAE